MLTQVPEDVDLLIGMGGELVIRAEGTWAFRAGSWVQLGTRRGRGAVAIDGMDYVITDMAPTSWSIYRAGGTDRVLEASGTLGDYEISSDGFAGAAQGVFRVGCAIARFVADDWVTASPLAADTPFPCTAALAPGGAAFLVAVRPFGPPWPELSIYLEREPGRLQLLGQSATAYSPVAPRAVATLVTSGGDPLLIVRDVPTNRVYALRLNLLRGLQ
jgi:hypothetical protein